MWQFRMHRIWDIDDETVLRIEPSLHVLIYVICFRYAKDLDHMVHYDPRVRDHIRIGVKTECLRNSVVRL